MRTFPERINCRGRHLECWQCHPFDCNKWMKATKPAKSHCPCLCILACHEGRLCSVSPITVRQKDSLLLQVVSSGYCGHHSMTQWYLTCSTEEVGWHWYPCRLLCQCFCRWMDGEITISQDVNLFSAGAWLEFSHSPHLLCTGLSANHKATNDVLLFSPKIVLHIISFICKENTERIEF